jgi:hypothetical protein
MKVQRAPREHLMSPRAKSGFIVGYIAFVLGVLFVLSMASEIQALPMSQAAMVVFVHMAFGYVIGWLIQPVLAAITGVANK